MTIKKEIEKLETEQYQYPKNRAKAKIKLEILYRWQADRQKLEERIRELAFANKGLIEIRDKNFPSYQKLEIELAEAKTEIERLTKALSECDGSGEA